MPADGPFSASLSAFTTCATYELSSQRACRAKSLLCAFSTLPSQGLYVALFNELPLAAGCYAAGHRQMVLPRQRVS